MGSSLDSGEAQDADVAELLAAGRLGPPGISLAGNVWLRRPFSDAPPGRLAGLCELDLSDCIRIEDDGACEAIKAAPGLERVDMRCCYGITDATLAELAGLAELRWLSLSGCSQITAERLGGFLDRRAAQLEALDLSGLVLVSDVALAGHAWPRLRELRLTGCLQLSSAGVTAVVREARALRTLHVAGLRTLQDDFLAAPPDALAELDASGCVQLTPRLFGHLDKLGKLERVTLDACPGVSARAVEAFCAARPEVRVRHAGASLALDGGLGGPPPLRTVARQALTWVAVAGALARLLTVELGLVEAGTLLRAALALLGAGAVYIAVAMAAFVLGAGL